MTASVDEATRRADRALTFVSLGRPDTQILKGVAIILIVLHNFLHWVGPVAGENQFAFRAGQIGSLGGLLAETPLEAIHLLLAWFGHYGVQVFLLLSAYGLMRAYGRRRLEWDVFLSRRLLRIMPVFVTVVALHAISISLSARETLDASYLQAYLWKLSLLDNIRPGRALSLMGPWWFFSLIVQFYALFPLLHRVVRRWGVAPLYGVAAGGMAARVLLDPVLAPLGINLLHTVVGHLPVLCLGLILARVDGLRLRWPMLALVGLLFALGQGWKPAWYVAPLCATLLAVASFRPLLGLMRSHRLVCRGLLLLGGLSLPLFAVHGVLRPPLVGWANAAAHPPLTLLIAALFLLVSVGTAFGVGRVAEGLRTRLADMGLVDRYRPFVLWR